MENVEDKWRVEFEAQVHGYGNPPFVKTGRDQYYLESLMNREWEGYLSARKKAHE